MSNQRLHVAAASALESLSSGGVRLKPGKRGGSSVANSPCSSGSVSPIPIPVIAISPGDESSESDIDAEPAKIFHRRVSTKRNANSSVNTIFKANKTKTKNKILSAKKRTKTKQNTFLTILSAQKFYGKPSFTVCVLSFGSLFFFI